MPPARRQTAPRAADYPETDVLMRASRVFTGIVAASVSAEAESITPAQLRALVLVATRPGMTAGLLADALDVAPSSGTRLCDRLVAAGWLRRDPSDTDRRHVELRLSSDGDELVGRIMARRRRVINLVLAQMTDADRRSLRRCLTRFCDAAAEPEASW